MRGVVVLALVSLMLAVSAGAQTTPMPQDPQQPAAAQQAAPPASAGAPTATPAAPAVTKSEILEQVVVRVNGEIFTRTELEARQLNTLRGRNQNMTEDQIVAALAEIMPSLLVGTVDEMLLLQRGGDLGYSVTEEQFARVLENIRKENKLEDDAQFAAALKQEGMDMAELRRSVERSMIVNQVQQVEVMGRIAVSEAEATKYYEEHKNEFTTPAQVTLRELSVSVPTDGQTMNVAQDEEAKKKAESALVRARKGESFEALVAELSDSPSKANGGLVGPVGPDELVAEVRTLIEPLKAGDVTEVFRTRGGWAILKLESATKSQVKTFDEAHTEISEQVFQNKRAGEILKYIQKLRAQATIDWKQPELKELYAKGLVDQAKTATAPAAAAAPKN